MEGKNKPVPQKSSSEEVEGKGENSNDKENPAQGTSSCANADNQNGKDDQRKAKREVRKHESIGNVPVLDFPNISDGYAGECPYVDSEMTSKGGFILVVNDEGKEEIMLVPEISIADDKKAKLPKGEE